MNAGAALARRTALVFLHADTRLPVTAEELANERSAGSNGCAAST
ncbi:MAG: hypothetical protein WAT23_14815 [Chromatiaceae bacterium]